MWDSSTIELPTGALTQPMGLEPHARPACLVVYSGAETGRRLVLEPGSSVIGRGHGASLYLDDPNLSRRHAELQVSAQGICLRDLGSSNGSWVNGRRIEQPQWLADGDRVCLGKLQLRFLAAGNPESAVHARAWHLANVDGLTGAWNRRYWRDALATAVRLAAQGGPPPAVLCGDLDFFKRVNDQYGHSAGDTLLQQVVQRVQARLRQGDLLGRLGGEEFGVLLPGTPQATALALAERLREAVASQGFMLDDGTGGGNLQHHQTMSWGVACWSLERADAPALIDLADRRLYEAKHGGRNCVRG
ncbi:GGDEF domain-containing protein [Aquabacterium sp. OR-4]|uniref:GGDEF domain-containing protein n=1 Tax=Aquabacterium sp. OR-4 TaxID=2978127 RepID=UPI0021B35DB6|nr:GGDEF domain-containing protein [Aquabacterium sp. OR-4]MDT7834821.1 GGDEF domain-containing protein [Aquabacterium sp. OR-4]